MGYDVTFHPFSRVDFKFFVDEVLHTDSYAEQVKRIHDDPRERQFVGDELYGKWAEFKSNSRADFGTSLGFSIAGVLGYLRPYWYSRGGLLSELLSHADFAAIPGRLGHIARPENRPVFEKDSGFIAGNFSSGCYVPFEQIDSLRVALENKANATIVEEAIGEFNLPALSLCLQYCSEQKLDLLEVSDLYTPGSGRCRTFPPNIRAAYLKNTDDFSNHSRTDRS